MRVRMLPISFVFSRFPRMVRDLSQRLGKQVELKVTGDQTELDKTVLEKIGDPLVHLVRNSVDHGIEMPEARVAAGKPPTGVVFARGLSQGRQHHRRSRRRRRRPATRPHPREGARARPDRRRTTTLTRRADLRADLHGRLLHRRADHRHLRPRRRHGRRATEHQGAGRHDRSALDARQGLALHHHAAADARDRRRPVGVGRQRDLHRAADHDHRIAAAQGRHASIASPASGEVFWFRDGYVPIVRLHEVFGVRAARRRSCTRA